MNLAAKSTIQEAIEVVAGALEEAGIRAVLVGGACATIYSGGTYTSEDLDLILQSAPAQKALDDAMASVGFTRREAQYFHEKSAFFVEFPRGPISIGRDVNVRPIRVRLARSRVLALSATDSCRDRLTAFYHWGDRQSLDVAVGIALNNRVNLPAIRKWSAGEGALDRFETFRNEIGRARRPVKRPRRRTGETRRRKPTR